jgi:hypothetical protein
MGKVILFKNGKVFRWDLWIEGVKHHFVYKQAVEAIK